MRLLFTGGDLEWKVLHQDLYSFIRESNTPDLTCDGPKVDVTFVLASGEGHHILRAIAVEMHGAQPLDALVSQDSNPSLCGGQHRHLSLGP